MNWFATGRKNCRVVEIKGKSYGEVAKSVEQFRKDGWEVTGPIRSKLKERGFWAGNPRNSGTAA